MPTLTGLASRLRQLRQRHKLTQEQFAETIGLNYKFYQQIEAGRKKQIWLETVERLAAGFRLKAWQLLAPEEPAHTVISKVVKEHTDGDQRAVAEPAATYYVKSKARKKRPNRS